MPSAAEIELTFETDPGFALPDLTGLPGVAAAAPAEERLLEATYFDTADLRLAAHRLTLRRRTGGHDAGWHLKRPRPDGYRDELQAPLGSVEDPPTELTRLVRVHARGQALVPAVRISTRRIATVLLDTAGEPLVEIAQDDVTTTVLAGGDEPREQSWHELEAELVGGGMDLFEAVREGLLAAGARLSAYPSKLARALGDRVRVPAAPDLEAGTAGEALLETLRQEVAGLITQDPLVRADAPDAVHQMRVGCRRLRALLAAYRGVLDADAVAPLRDELRWLGEELGAARDAEVVGERLRALAAAEPAELVLGPVERRIAETYSGRYRRAHDRVLGELDGDRYFALLDALDGLVEAPPLGQAAGLPAWEVYEDELRRTYRRVRRAVRAARSAGDSGDSGHRDELLHEVRKASKRARYAAEAATGVLGGRARRYGKAMKKVQTVLGEFQDSVVTRHELRELAVAAHLDGENAFTYGRLHGLEQARAAATVQEFDGVWRAARKQRP